MRYLLDANVFMAANNLHYGLDFCPAFWDWLIDRNQAGQVFSIDKVKDEIEAGDDELAVWAKAQDEQFFLKPGADIFPAMGQVTNWVNDNGYTPDAKNTCGLLAHCPRPDRRFRRGDPRAPRRYAEQGQDSQCMRGGWTQGDDALRDAAARTGAICPGA